MNERLGLLTGALSLLVAGALAVPLAAQEGAAAEGTSIELERSSHVVRPEEDRLLARFGTGRWRFAALVASRTPRFFGGEDRFGLGTEVRIGENELAFVARSTEDDQGGEELVGSLRWAFRQASGASFAAELTYASDDLTSDGFLSGQDEGAFAGRLLYRRAGGLEIELFGSESASYDLRRGTRELLERLPRSEIFGVETLADLDIDEGRLEDAVGVAVGSAGEKLSWRAYVKTGDQTIRGLGASDDVDGFGGSVGYRGERFEVRSELDVRDIDSADAVSSFYRGRLFVDALGRFGRFELGGGGYLQGESDSLGQLVDVYDTGGLALGGKYRLSSGRTLGLWVMGEDNAPDSQKIGRLAFVYGPPSGAWEAGLGVRRDELGRSNFQREETGPFASFKGRFPSSGAEIDAHVGTIDSETYGRILIRFAR